MKRWIAASVLLMVATFAWGETRRYGDLSYKKPLDCSINTEQNKLNPFGHLFRDQCKRINATPGRARRVSWDVRSHRRMC
jgi:hypothetical protein